MNDLVREQELFQDSMSPEQIASRPHTLSDLERKIAAVTDHLARIEARILKGHDLEYWQDCRWRARQQLAIYEEAKDKLVQDAVSRGYAAYAAWLDNICDQIRSAPSRNEMVVTGEVEG